MSKWDERLLHPAILVSYWSKDPSTKVGALIADNSNRIVSVGYNGLPRNVKDGENMTRAEKLRRTIHAEANAILFAQRDITGFTIYVTHHPCGQCAALIIQSGLKRVVYPKLDDISGFSERWKEEVESAATMFAEAGVEVSALELENAK